MNWEDFDPEKAISEIESEKRRTWNNRIFPDLGKLVPEADDPNVLFRNNWLGRGQAFTLVASSGVGKSSMTAQMAMHWAIGMEFLATPLRPMKIAIIQAEDSDRDLQEQRDGMVKGLTNEGWSQDMIDRAFSQILLPTDFIGFYGDDFTNRLADYQHDMKCDLLFINPLQRFFGGELSSQKDASAFCAKIDEIMKNPEDPCATGIVMHTPKFHSGNAEGRQAVDDYAEYAMAGSQEWTAWVRAVLNFQKHGSSEIYFDVKASKRGSRLKWKDASDNLITKRIFKHSDGFIYWQEVTDPEEIATIPEAVKPTSPSKKDKLPFDLDSACVYWANEITNSRELQAMGTNELRAFIYEGIKRNGWTKADARAIFDHLAMNPEAFGLVQKLEGQGKKTFSPANPDAL